MSVQRIALVSPYALSVFGGVQEQVLAMSRELSSRGRDVLVISPDSSDHQVYETPATVERYGRLISLPANGSRAPLSLSWNASRDVHRCLTRFRPDVIHYHEPFAPLIGWSSLRSHDAPQLATFHRSGGGPAFDLTKPLLRSLARHIDLTTAVSEAAASTIHRAVGIDAEVLFNGFETERFREKPRTRSDEIVFVTVGRLEERKGTGVAIRAVLDHNAVSSEPWRLIIIGDGPQRPRLEAIAAGSNKIRFVGALSDADKREWLRRAHALIAPSTRGESFGLVLLEAMASETRVVASDIPGYRDAAGEHALLFEPANDVSLQAALATAISSETPAAIEAARLYAEHWSMQRLMDRYENLYVAAHVRFAEPR